MIKINNVSKSYVKDKLSVDDLSLEIKDGEIFGFLGPNGAGKTTTINMITGVLNMDSGNIMIDNYDISKDPINAKKSFSYVPDSPDMFLRLKGIEYLNFIADIYDVSKNDREAKIKDITKRFEIENVLNNTMQSYSHGMRQKIIITGMLLFNPKNWILDEPLTGLDPKSSYTLKEMMREHANKGNSVFFSTHVLEVAEKICDRIGVINKGKLIFVGTYAELRDKFKEESSLEDLFLEMTKDE